MSRDPENGPKSLTEPTGMPVRDSIARRVSCRAYQATPVAPAQLMQLLVAGRWGEPGSLQELHPATVAVCRSTRP